MRITGPKAVVVVGAAMAAFLFTKSTEADPVVTYSWTTNNDLTLTVTNHVAGTSYSVLSRPLLGDSLYPWSYVMSGATNQTNFVITNFMVYPTGFFELTVGNDWDNDHVTNDQDAQPGNAGIGALAITIDFPTDGSVLL